MTSKHVNKLKSATCNDRLPPYSSMIGPKISFPIATLNVAIVNCWAIICCGDVATRVVVVVMGKVNPISGDNNNDNTDGKAHLAPMTVKYDVHSATVIPHWFCGGGGGVSGPEWSFWSAAPTASDATTAATPTVVEVSPRLFFLRLPIFHFMCCFCNMNVFLM